MRGAIARRNGTKKLKGSTVPIAREEWAADPWLLTIMHTRQRWSKDWEEMEHGTVSWKSLLWLTMKSPWVMKSLRRFLSIRADASVLL